jgi:hypothetical protein
LCGLQVDEAQKALQFVSISSDGNVNVWTMNKSELTHESLMKLRVVSAAAAAAKVRGCTWWCRRIDT